MVVVGVVSVNMTVKHVFIVLHDNGRRNISNNNKIKEEKQDGQVVVVQLEQIVVVYSVYAFNVL